MALSIVSFDQILQVGQEIWLNHSNEKTNQEGKQAHGVLVYMGVSGH
jgi:hypothetical protein